MAINSISKNEQARLKALNDLKILDTKPELRFNKITNLALEIFKVPISSITLVDSDRVWFKSFQGLKKKQGERSGSFCEKTVLEKKIFLVPDTKKDSRFKNHPIVKKSPFIRFYAGAPLFSLDGHVVGSFCIKDIKPRNLSKFEITTLQQLASWAEKEINYSKIQKIIKRAEKLNKKEVEINLKLYEKNELLQATLKSIGDGVIVTDTKARVIDLNKVAEKLTGWKINEARNKKIETIFNIINEKTRKKVINPVIKAIKSKKNVDLANHTILISKNNKEYQVADSCAPIKDENNKILGAVLVFRDVSLEYENQKKIKESEEYNRSILNTLPDLIIHSDKNGTFLDIITNNEKKLFLPKDKIIGQKIKNIFPPKEANLITRAINKTIKSQKLQIIEYSLPIKNNKLWFEARISPFKKTQTIALIIDITEKKINQEKIEQEKQKFKSITENIPGAVYRSLVDKNWTMKFISPEIERVSGYPASDFIDNKKISYSDIIHPSDKSMVVNKIFQANQKKESFNIDYRIVNKKGRVIWVQEKGKTLFNKNNKPQWIDGSIFNISRQKEKELFEKKQLEFQKIVTQISSDFIPIKTKKEFDETINKTLMILGNFFDIDRSYLFTFSSDLKLMTNTHEWCKPGISSHKNKIVDFKTDLMPWWKNEIKKLKPLQIKDTSKLPKSAKAEKKEFESQNIKSLICLPILNTKKSLLGFIGFDSVKKLNTWSNNEIEMLKIFSNIIGGVVEKVNIEKKRKESEEKFKQITENIDNVAWLRSADNQKMIYISPSYKNIWKRSCQSLYDNPSSFIESAHPDDKEDLLKAFKLYQKTGFFNHQYRIITGENKVAWIQAKSFPVKNEKGQIIRHAGVAMDITKLKLLENNLKRFKQATESATPAIYISSKEGNIEYANESFAKITGHKVKDILGKNPRFLKSGKMPLKYYKKLWQTLLAKKPWEEEVINKKKNGQLYYAFQTISPILNDKNKIEAFVAIQNDISENKKIEKELKEKTDELERYFTSSLDLLCIANTDGKFIKLNPEWEKVLGYKISYLEGKQFLDFVHPEDIEDTLKTISTLNKQETVLNFSNRYRCLNGEYKWIEWRSKPIGKNIYAVARDITEKKEHLNLIQNRLEEQKLLAEISVKLNKDDSFSKKMNLILKKIGLFSNSDRTYIFEFDNQKKTTSNTYEWCAENIKPEIDNLQNLNFNDIKHFIKELKENNIIKYNDTNKAKKSIRDFLKPQGIKSILILPLEIKGEQIGFIGFDQVKTKRNWINSDVHFLKIIANSLSIVYEREKNIKEIKKQANKIENEKNKIETIIQGIGDGVFVVDKNLNIIMFNPKAEEISGYKAEEAIGQAYKKVLKFVYEDSKKTNDKFIINTFKFGKGQKMTNHTLLYKKDGTSVEVADSAAPLKDENGEIFACVVVFRDVSKERIIDKAKTEFVSLASHQLKTPLGSINWDTEMLLNNDYGKLEKKPKEIVNEIHQMNKRMITLVDSLLNVSRLEMGKLNIEIEKININKIIDDLLKEMNILINKKNHQVIKNYQRNLNRFLIDQKLIRIVIQNFLSNAIKYSPSNGKIEINLTEKNNQVIISITNTGEPIPKKDQDKIFSRMFRASNAQEIDPDGNGLGLYLVKLIAKASGGKTWFKSDKKSGTTFYFSFPKSGMKKENN